MTYARDAWYVAGWSHELEPQTPFAITILDERIVLWRTPTGALHALEDRCVHRLAPLSLGRCEGEALRCGYHGLLFDGSGKCIAIPGQETIPPQARVRRYPAIERHSWIWVWMGDPARADEDLVPPAVGLDNPDYILGHGHLDYAAQARLICDNLLDFSHLTFVHAQSFGAGSEFADTPARITPLPRGIRYERWIENSLGSSSRVSATPMDSYMAYDFLVPGVLLMKGGTFAPGTATRCGYGAPDYAGATGGVTFTSQAVTPMTGDTARYFFSWGPHRAHGDAALRDTLMDIAGRAFAEDKTMIEAQQRVIAATPDPAVMPTVHDKAVILYNRLVERLARQPQPA